jgi:endonuclease/exonuclease/phosphatase family metal-dependent hydrolase
VDQILVQSDDAFQGWPARLPPMHAQRFTSVCAALALVALVLPSLSLADVIHLESGGRYRGKIVKETARTITIVTKAGGKIRVPRNEISKIVREEDFAKTFKTRFAKLKESRDVKRWCELGAWAGEKQLKTEAASCFERALKLDATCKPARLALGHRFHKKRWYTPDAYRREVLGLVPYKGRWVKPLEKANLEAGLVLRDGRWVLPKSKTAPAAGAGKRVPKSPKRVRPPKGKQDKEKSAKVRKTRGAKFRAMSFNIRYDFKNDGDNRWPRRVSAVAKMIKQAPVVGIQEDKGRQIDDLRPLLPGYKIVGGGRNPTGSGERCSILVRRSEAKIREWGEFWLSDTPDVKGSNTWRDRYPRKVTWALIELKSARTPILLLNTHLPEKDSGRDPENRIKGMRVMNEFIQKRLPKKERKKVAILITGDYNSTPSEEPRKTLVGSGPNALGLRDAWTEASSRPSFGGTFNAFKGLRGNHRIDWILVGGPVRVRRYETLAEKVDGRWPSDHYPITASLELR